MNDRDRFAAAAAGGLLMNGDYSTDAIPSLAYSMADAMLCERSRSGKNDAESVQQPAKCTGREMTLTAGEREAIDEAIRRLWGFDIAATLRSLLERMK